MPAPKKQGVLLTAKQTADYLGIYEKEALELMQEQKINSVVISNSFRTTEEQIEIFLKQIFSKKR